MKERSTPRAQQDPGRRPPRGTAKDRALLLLGVRWRSREELRVRLTRAGFEIPDVEQALADLERTGLVDDQRFAREVVRAQGAGRLSGDRAIRAALRQKGVSPTDVEEALDEAGEESGRALELASRRARRLVGLAPEAAYRRLFGQLVRRGYGPAVAREACRAALADLLAGESISEGDA